MKNHIEFKVRPVIKYFGGKYFLARRIVDLLPQHSTYVEPFAGGLNVLLNKFKSHREVAGDLNGELIHLYQTITTSTDEVLSRLVEIPYTEESFKRAVSAVGSETPDPVERALNFLVKHRMSRGGMGGDFSKDDRAGIGEFWSNLPDDLVFTAHRLKDVVFHNLSALTLIDMYDSRDTLHYCDPPYYPSTRSAPKVYDFEMTHMDHLRLLKRLKSCEGSVALSGYSNPIYNGELKGWDRYDFDMANHSSQEKTKSKRVETVWVKESQGA